MAKVIAFTVELNGIKGAVTDGASLQAAIKATNDEFKKADFGSKKYKDLQAQLGGLKKIQADVRAETRNQSREFTIAADKGKGSYRALNAELVNLRAAFKELSAIERNSKIGDDMLKRINQLDQELKGIDASIGNFQRNVGNYQSAFEGLSGIDLSSFATIPGAIAAGGAAALEAGKFVKELVDDFRELRGEIQALTGATGDDLDEFTTRIAAISETFDVSREEILNSANSLTDQLTGNFSESLDLIETGFIGSLDASGEFLDQLKEYPTFFAEAGFSADQMLNIIDRQVDAGIFSDKGIDAVKEATIRLRELPKPVREALSAIGIDAEKIRKKIDEEGIGAAIQSVSAKLGDFKDDSPEVGQAIADIFGGAGEDAGVDFIKSLATIEDTTDGLIDKSNEYQLQQEKTLQVNKDFAAVQNELAKQLGGASASFDDIGTIIKTGLLQVLVFVIERTKLLWDALQPVRDALARVGQALGLVSDSGEATGRAMTILQGILDAQEFVWKLLGEALGFVIDQIANFVEGIIDALEWLGILDEDAAAAAASTEDLSQATEAATEATKKKVKADQDGSKSTRDYKKEIEEAAKATDKLKKSTEEAAVVGDKFAKDSIANLKKEVSDLKKELEGASDADAKGILENLLKAEEALESAQDFRRQLRERLVSGEPIAVKPLVTLDLEVETPGADELLKSAIEERDERLRINAELQELLLEQERERAEEVRAINEEVFSNINDAIGFLQTASEARYESEVSALENRYEREIELAEGNEDLQEQLEEELAKKKEEIQKREFERQKRFRVAAALSSLAEGIINTLSAPSVIPDPAGSVFKAIRVAILTATAFAQIAKINAQKAAAGAIISGNHSSDSLGFVARGATHDDPGGGIPTILNGRPVLVESGEFMDYDESGNAVVVNKRSSAAFAPQLRAIAGLSFPGKGSYLSDVNSYKNYGIAFAQEGTLVPNLDTLRPGPGGGAGSTGSASITVTLTDEQVIAFAAMTGNAVKEGSKQGTILGLDEANRNAEREAIKNERAGLT